MQKSDFKIQNSKRNVSPVFVILWNLKWAARGLSAEDAAHKANVDLDVSRNCIK